ncbi:MAG: hypothetical protein K6F21_00350 [Bacteroidales bacterium]|nr:hypothetical protein [Bacteroidales bacterium]
MAILSCGKSDPETPIEQNEEEPVVESTLVFDAAVPQTLSFSPEVGTIDVKFTCSDVWTASIAPEGVEGSWVSVYPHSGAAGEGKVTVTVKINETLEANAATLVFKFKDKTAELPITQEGLKRLRFTYTGEELLAPLAATYDEFLKEDLMPKTWEVCGETLTQGYYYEAMCRLLADIAKGGDTWKTTTYKLDRCIYSGSSSQYETYAPDQIDLEKILWINDRQYTYASNHNKVFANYCTVDNSYFSLTRSTVVSARFLHAFYKEGSFPETVSSWQSDFLRDLNYDSGATTSTGTESCSLNDPAVIAARDAAIEGKTTTMEKAIALFEYARDQWEWMDYNNTRKGALKVIAGKEGNCCDLSHGLIAMSRSAGIPARYVHGPQTYYPSGNIYGHVWAELYVDGKWYTCDASNNECTFDTPKWILEKSEIRGKYKDLPF